MASMNFDYEKLGEPARGTLSTKSKPAVGEELDESRLEPRKCRYGPGVLVGNWYERRIKYVPPPNDWTTMYDSTYTCKRNPELKRDGKTFKENKKRAEGLGTEFLIEHYGNAFYNNYATTNDLFYRVIPLRLCGPRLRKYSSRKDLWIPELDLSNNFGNVTNFGLADAVEFENVVTSKPSPRLSINATSFKKPIPSAVKRIPKPKGSFNEPHLLHLDIDPNQTFRPHLIKTKK